jgi:hypothetical protein
LPFSQSFPPLPFCPRFIQLPLKRIFRKPANFFPESNQLFVGHFAQFIPQLPQNFFVRLETDIVAPGEAKREEEILLRCWRFVALIRSDQRYERELSWISICIFRSTAVLTLCIEFPTITKY